uniref:CENP-V/GFA domain-containing protein n=1 Tax=Psilocybe cubensis TaxID=181762 RepID=A0A8H7Y190_PSICU
MSTFMEDENTIYIKSQCHCGIGSFQVAFAKSRIPVTNFLCHCDICRHVSEGPPIGGPYAMQPIDPSKDSSLTEYRTSASTAWYFCHNCSAHLFLLTRDSEWFVSGGSLRQAEGLTELYCHINVADTMDGGLADQIQVVDGKVLPRYSKRVGSEQIPLGWRSDKLQSRTDSSRTSQKMRAYCHCGAIDIYVTRPNELSAQPYAPYPDILYPLPQTRLSTIRNKSDVKWWLDPPVRKNSIGMLVPASVRPSPGGSREVGSRSGSGSNLPAQISTLGEAQPAVHSRTRFLAGHCVCSHCRQGCGFDIQSWMFVSRTNVFEKGSDKPIVVSKEEERPKGLKQYLSSPGRYHEFCGTCGATAFWWQAGRPDVIDVSVGLLDQSIDGVRAENWLKWHKDRLSYVENSAKNNFVQGLKDGMAKLQDSFDAATPLPTTPLPKD